jgi:hypothetical protein
LNARIHFDASTRAIVFTKRGGAQIFFFAKAKEEAKFFFFAKGKEEAKFFYFAKGKEEAKLRRSKFFFFAFHSWKSITTTQGWET